jgi:hypothetical protein
VGLRYLLDAAQRGAGSSGDPPIDLVLDGVDRPRAAGGARDVVARLVEQPPEGVRVVLVARSKPGSA